ncbi:cell wall-binding repeat-containing protein [Bacillus coahuilensis]|uniref:cell wall-binding repeat-containing protein n=1 Tax=Bacillus coahuilensis TaxID=408580 RepID=UPI0001851257|nr:cell wall-binding repeat-containing protein [Bacillus coahuilensis]
MKGNNKLFPLVVLLFIFASLSINGQTTSATESNVVNLQVGTSTHNLEGHEINTSNAFLSTLTITTNNQSFSDELYGGVYEQIILAGSETAPLAIVTKRLDGTARVLTFDVLSLKENGWTKVHSSNDYLKGSLTVENNVLTVQHAKYNESDANYAPTYVLEDQFSIEDSKVTLLDTTTSNLKSSSFQSVTTTSDSEFTGLNRVQQLALTVTGNNPTPQELNAILTKKAYEHNIPPEVLKTIAYLESSWQQYNNDGHPRISTLDGQGVGLMQVTDGTLTMSEDKLLRLMTDIEYNIDEGIRILEAKYGYIKAGILPTINEQDRTILEHWYWPIAAYNGISSINNPLTNPGKTYQEKFFKKLEEFSHISVTPFPSSVLQGVIYVDSKGILRFKQKNLTIPGPFHKTAHDLEKNSIVTVSATSVSLRTSPDLKSDKSNVYSYLSQGEAVKIKGDIQNDPSKLVHFPWYPVELPSQPGKIYYIAGSYLNNINLFDYRQDLSGGTRYNTSSLIADYGWNTSSDVVVLARGDVSIDGLAGSVLADKYNAPLLLTDKDTIPSTTLTTIKRLKPNKNICIRWRKCNYHCKLKRNQCYFT